MNTATNATVSPLVALLGLPTQEEWDAGVGLNPKKPQYIVANGWPMEHHPDLDFTQTSSAKLKQHVLTEEEEEIIANAPERNARHMRIRTNDPDLMVLDNLLINPGNDIKGMLRAYFNSKRTGQEGKIVTYPVSFQEMGPEQGASDGLIVDHRPKLDLSDRADRQVRENAVRSVSRSRSAGSGIMMTLMEKSNPDLGSDFDKRLQQEVDDHHSLSLDQIFNSVDITPSPQSPLDEIQKVSRVNRTAEFLARRPTAVKVPYPTIGDYLKPVPMPSPTKLQLFISKLFYPEPKEVFEPYRPLKKQDGRLYIDDCPHFQEKIQDTPAKRALMYLRDVPDQISWDLLSFKGLAELVLDAVIDSNGHLASGGVRELEQEGYYVLYHTQGYVDEHGVRRYRLHLHSDRFQGLLLESDTPLFKA